MKFLFFYINIIRKFINVENNIFVNISISSCGNIFFKFKVGILEVIIKWFLVLILKDGL